MSKLSLVRALIIASLVACSGGGGSGDSGDDAPPPSDGRAGLDARALDAATVDAAAIADPGLPGTWRVVVRDNVAMTVGAATLRGTVFSPSTDGATPATGPFPLVIVSSGYQLQRTQYAPYCQHLASWGYICITYDYAASGNHQAKARDVGRLIDWALGPGGLGPVVQPGAIAVAGHSLGGKVSINAAILDSRIKAVIGWDPVDALPPFGNDGSMSVTPEMMGNLRVPLALLGEQTDGTGAAGMACAPTADNYQQYFVAACNAPARLEVTIDQADHMDWIADRASCGLACLVCRNGQTPEATVQTITKRVTTAWLERHLRANPAAAAWLTTPQVGTPATLRTTAPGC